MSDTPILGTRGRIVTSGFVALDVIIEGSRMGHQAGGTAGNVAANLAFLGWTASVTALVGSDPAGRRLRYDLARAGVHTTAVIRRDDVVTPVVIHEVLDASHRFRFGCPVCGRRFPRYRPLPLELAKTLVEADAPDVFFFDRTSLSALLLAAGVRDAGGLVVFEPASRRHEEHFRRAMRLAHIVKFSQERLGRFEDLLHAPSRRQLHVMTAGSAGAYWRRGNGVWHHVSPLPMPIVDPGGAGDWTTAGILSSLPTLTPADLSHVDASALLRAGQALGAMSCASIGARGLSAAMTYDEVVRALSHLLKVGHNDPPPNHLRLRPSRRRAACEACLAGSSA